MNEKIDERVENALDAYALALRGVRPSPQLDARIQAAINREMSRPRSLSRAGRKPVWAVAAGSALIVAMAAVWVLMRHAGSVAMTGVGNPLPQQIAPPLQPGEVTVLPTGGISLWPTEATVFRVRGTFGTAQTEQQLWLDVRVANDGSMRIERVLSADGAELFARPGIHD